MLTEQLLTSLGSFKMGTLRSPAFIFFLLIVAAVPCVSALDYKLKLLLPSTTSNHARYQQWSSLATYTAQLVSARWNPANTLSIDIVDYHSNPIELATQATTAFQDNSVIALLTDENSANQITAFGASSQTPILVPVSESAPAASLPAFYDPFASSTYRIQSAFFEVDAIKALCERYNWHRIALVYSLDDEGVTIRKRMETLPGLTISMLGVKIDGFSSTQEEDEAHLEAVDEIIRGSVNVIFVALPDGSKQLKNLIKEARDSQLIAEGKAWIFLHQIFNSPTESYGLSSTCNTASPSCILASSPCMTPSSGADSYYSPGSWFLKVVDACPSNRTRLLTTIQSLSYPGTGSSAVLQRGSAELVDGINMIAKSIETILATGGTVSRTTLNNTLSSVIYEGLTGKIRFDGGSRIDGVAEFCSVNASSQVDLVMTYRGSENGGMNVVVQNPSWPGSTHSIPDDEIEYVQVAAIWSFTGNIITADARQWVKNTLSYGAYWVNENAATLLPEKTKLSLVLYDDLGSPGLASQYALKVARRGFSAVLGGLSPTMCAALQGVLSGFSIPQISTGVTSAALSNKELYPSFMRTVPSNAVSGEAVIMLAKKWGWTEGLVMVTSIDSGGNGVAETVLNKAIVEGIHIERNFVLQANQPNYDAEAAELIAAKPRVVLFLVSYDTSIPLMRSLYKANFKPEGVLCIEFIGPSTYMPQYAASTGTSVEFYQGWLVVGSPGGVGPMWDQLLQNTSRLTGSQWIGVSLISRFVPLNYDTFYIIADSVRRLKEGLVDLVSSTFGSSKRADSTAHLDAATLQAGDVRNGTHMLKALKSFSGQVFSGPVHFDESGDRNPEFDLVNVKGGEAVSVGRYSAEAGLVMYEGKEITWPDGSTNIPLSRLPRNQTWLKWNSGAGIALSIISGVGMVICVGFLAAFGIYRDAPVIKSSTWQFLIVMLVGALLGFGSMWVWVGRPEKWICALRIWLPPMAFILIIAPLLAKTWRLHRIFTLADLQVKPIPLHLLVGIVSILAGVQIVLCLFWISLGTINPIIINDPADSTLAYVLCGSNRTNRILAYVTYAYIGLLIVSGGYLAFKVRKLPRDFNESKWIARTIYNISLFAILIIILGYSLSKYYIVVLILICVCTLAICYGSMLLMMAPKIWTLYKHPEKRSSISKNSSRSAELRTGSIKAAH